MDAVGVKYSPPHTIVRRTPIISRFRGYLEVITPDSDAKRVPQPCLHGYGRAAGVSVTPGLTRPP